MERNARDLGVPLKYFNIWSMKILHITPAFFPATYWGGPVVSIFSLCNELSKLSDVQLKVLTTNAAGPHNSQCIEVSNFPVYYPSGYEVYFTRRILGREFAPGLIARLIFMIHWADVVHLSGTYSFATIPTLLVCRAMGKPLVWSSHGALQAAYNWSDARKQRLKTVWEWLCGLILPRSSVLHVTTEEEKAASLKRMEFKNVAVVPHGVEIPCEIPNRPWRPNGCLRLMFLGRLDPIKGIENLLGAVEKLDEHVLLGIYGTGEEAYVDELRKRSKRLGLVARVSFKGEVQGEQKAAALWNADLCIVPSFSENFGMVVAEALAHGVPVIASKGAPWRELENKGAGYWVDSSSDSLARAINKIQGEDLEAMGLRGRDWMKASYNWQSVAQKMYQLYESILEH